MSMSHGLVAEIKLYRAEPSSDSSMDVRLITTVMLILLSYPSQVFT